MTERETSWSDPLHQAALRALIRSKAALDVVGHDESHWVIDSMRSAIVLRVGDKSRAAIESFVRDRVGKFPRGGVDFVLVGGGEGMQQALHDGIAESKARTIGLAHVNDAGAVWTERTHDALAKALASVFEKGVPEAEPYAEFAVDMALAEEEGRPRLDALRDFSQRMKGQPATATIVLVAALAAIFAAEWAFGRLSGATLIRMGACVPERVKHGEVWRVLSSALLHVGMIHIGCNAASLLSLGSFYERLIGRGRYLVLFVAAAIGAGLASTFITPHQTMVGASGGIFGLLGASGALALRPRKVLPPDVMPAFRNNVVVNFVLMLGFSSLPQVSWSAHLGGAIVGFVLMLSGVLVPRGADAERARRGWKIPGVLAVALMIGSFGIALAKGHPWATTQTSWRRQSLPGTAFSVELPGSMHVQPRTDDVKEFVAGDAEEDGFEVSVLVQDTEPLETDAERTEAAEQIRAREGGLAHPEGTQLAGSPQTTVLNGFPVVTQDATAANGVRFRHWLQVRAHAVVSVQIIARPDVANIADSVPQRILASLTGDR